MRFFNEMKVLSSYDDGRISIEELKEMAKWQLADIVAEKVVKEAKVKVNPEGTYIIATWDTVNPDEEYEVFEWPTP